MTSLDFMKKSKSVEQTALATHCVFRDLFSSQFSSMSAGVDRGISPVDGWSQSCSRVTSGRLSEFVEA